MAISVLLIALGLVLLVAGGELLVRGATTIARLAGVSPSVVGVTIVAAGTSMPELVVSLDAAIGGSAELAVGNVVGSNIFNIGAILGIAALVAPLVIRGNAVRLEWPLMFLSACLLFLFSRDGSIDRLEGGFFAVGLIAFVAYMVRVARVEVSSDEADQWAAASRGGSTSMWRAAITALGGCGVLAGGAHLLVVGAVDLAEIAGLSKTVIGLTIVAAGTSLPELAASIVAAYRGHNDIAVANVLGSNIFNVLGIAGITAVVQPLEVQSDVIERDAVWMVGFSIILFPLMRSGMRVSRLEGAALLCGFGAYLVVLLT